MAEHRIGMREERLPARLDLLKAEKERTRPSGESTRRRHDLPWVRIDKDYRFETDGATAFLANLFRMDISRRNNLCQSRV